jgi:DNA-3-methyladenine glycosylase I
MIDYRKIFNEAEHLLREQSSFSDSEFDKHFGRFKRFEHRTRTDDEIFRMLVMIIFYSGFRASIVENKEAIILNHFPNYNTVSQFAEYDIQGILSDPEMIKNKLKVIACVSNAVVFKNIVQEHGSFQNYLDGFKANESFENLILLKEELEHRFVYLGGITVYHFLTDLGFNVLKPDRVMLRIFKRLGLIETDKQLLKTVIQGRKFAEATEYPIRYIDIIFVKYGQEGESKMFGLKNGICIEHNPNCQVCRLTAFCDYFKKQKMVLA